MMNSVPPKRPKPLYKIIFKLLFGLFVILAVGFLAWLLLFSTNQIKTVPRNIPNDDPVQSSY